jgi:hemerythrin
MAAHGFPQLDGHRAEHLAFRTQIVYLSDEVASHGATIPFEVHDRLCRYLCDWLRKHILYTDMGYRAFFDERGVC